MHDLQFCLASTLRASSLAASLPLAHVLAVSQTANAAATHRNALSLQGPSNRASRLARIESAQNRLNDGIVQLWR
jgi:hypothetical protein